MVAVNFISQICSVGPASKDDDGLFVFCLINLRRMVGIEQCFIWDDFGEIWSKKT